MQSVHLLRLATVVMCALCIVRAAPAQVTLQWAHTIDDASAHGTDIAKDGVIANSYLYVVGTVSTGVGQSAIIVTKYDVNCTNVNACSPPSMRWPATPNGRVNEGVAITVDPMDSNTLYVAGRAVNASGNSDFVLLKVTSGLAVDSSWAVNPRVYDNLGEDLAVDVSANTGAVGIAGKSIAAGTGWDYAAVVYQQSDGAVIGSPVRWAGSGTDTPVGLYVAGGDNPKDGGGLGSLIVGGTSNSFGTSNDYWTVKYDFDGAAWVFSPDWASTGNGIGRRRYNNPTWGGSDTATCMWSNGGIVIISGSSLMVAIDSFSDLDPTPPTDIDYCTVGYDLVGGPQWPQIANPWGAGVHRYGGPANGIDVPAQVTLGKLHGAHGDLIDDGVYVALTGRSVGVGTSYDYATIIFDAYSGANETTYRTIAAANEQASSLDFVLSGGWRVGYFYMTGKQLIAGGNWDILTDGRQGDGTVIPLPPPRWPRVYNGPGNGNDLAWFVLTNWQDVFVGGQALNTSPKGLDSVTIKYHQEP